MAQATAGRPPGVRADDGVFLHLEIVAHPNARLTVVLCHGFAARLEEFDAQRSALGEHARVVLYDQRGHGRSGWSGPRSATIDRLGDDLACVIAASTNAHPVVLVGHSMGGMAVLALARRRPDLFADKVIAVALISTSAGRLAQVALPPKLARLMVRTGMASAALWLIWAVAPAIDLLAPFRTTLGRRWLRRRLFGRVPPPEDVVSAMEQMWTNTPQSMAAALYPAMVAYDATGALKALRSVPTLVLTGTDDAAIPAQHSHVIARELGPEAQLVLVPDAGHMVNMTHPTIVNAALVGLLRQVERREQGSRTT